MAKKQAQETYDQHIRRKQAEIVNRRLRVGDDQGLPVKGGQEQSLASRAFDPSKRLEAMTLQELEQRYGNTNPQSSNPNSLI
jgi:hypothetical protein